MTLAAWRAHFFRLVILMAFMFMFFLMDLPKMRLEEEIPSKTDSILSQAATILTEKLGLTTNTKTILLWTTFFKVADFYTGYGNRVFKDCPYSNCETTSDRGLLTKSSAVVFHAFNVDLKDLPESRTPDQSWVFFYLERPYHLPPTLRNTSNLFNLTMTYRTDSDIPSLYIETINDWPLVEDQVAVKEILGNKSKLVAWFVSHCHTESRREDYVEELRKYIDVDVYGPCGSLKCADRVHRESCYPMLTKDYKFYLPFENAICRDYVTEKFYQALRHYVVPIVNGAADYTQFAPEGSFIHIRDFESPQHMAKYLQYLDKNQTAYEQYFEWRKTYVPSYKKSWCQLCEMLNNSTLPSKSYDNIYDWWVEGQCNNQKPMETSRPEVSFTWKNRSAVGTQNTL